jgi:hypothetical protein
LAPADFKAVAVCAIAVSPYRSCVQLRNAAYQTGRIIASGLAAALRGGRCPNRPAKRLVFPVGSGAGLRYALSVALRNRG